MLVSYFEFARHRCFKIFKTLWPLFLDRLHLPHTAESLCGDNLLLITMSPAVPDIHLLDTGGMKDLINLVNVEDTKWF